MERQKGRTIITMETFQRTTIRSRKAADARCERCAADVPSEAAAHQQIVREALLQIESGEIEAKTRRMAAGALSQTCSDDHKQ